MMGIETVAVLGTGRDAVGFALLCSLAGLDVRIGDESQDALDAAFHALRQDVERALTGGLIDHEERQRILDGILITSEPDEATLGADLVVAATRDVDGARALVDRLARTCRATTVLATRHDPGEVSAGALQPGRIVGLELDPGEGPFPRVALRLRPGTTAHARARWEELAARLERAAGYSSR
jgi:3-hydroxybutyryl-CoA dehydrogenase